MLSRMVAFLCRSILLLLPLLVAASQADAAQRVVVSVEQAILPLGRAQDIKATLNWVEGASSPDIELSIGRLDASEVGYVFTRVKWRCQLEDVAGRSQCKGPASAEGLRRGELLLAFDESALSASLTRGSASLAADYRFEQATADLQAGSLPMDWLAPLQEWLWAEAQVQGGQLSGKLALDLSQDESLGVSGRLALQGLDLDTPDGKIASAGLGLQADLSGSFGDSTWSLTAKGPVLGGEILLGPLYASLPPKGVELDLALQGRADGSIALQRLHWTDGGVLNLQTEALLQPKADDVLAQLSLQGELSDLAAAQARYGESLLGTLGLAGLQIEGRATVAMERADGGWQRLNVTNLAATARDAAGRFAFDEVVGDLAWTAGDAAARSQLAWKQIEVYGLSLGASGATLESRAGGMALAQAILVPAFAGALEIGRLHWLPGGDEEGPSLDLGIELRDLDLAELSSALKWPAFTGRMSGSLPRAYYAKGTLTLDGGLRMELFGGSVDIGQLILERPFGVAPTLSADVRFANLDLQPLTAVFGFGEITGRMEGHIRGLRLLDWSPAAFEAELRTVKDAPGPRRISQRAVRDLSSVGGGGLAGGIQASFLRAFETFGYSRIGISCRLERNICYMGGIDSSGQGYTIVEGSGLPRISVVGFQRKVDWPVLMERLQATAAGQRPTID